MTCAAHLGVQDRPHVSTTVVSAALATGLFILVTRPSALRVGSHTEVDLAAGMSAYNPERAAELLAALEEYRLARERLLSVLGRRMSNRDLLAEFAEHFVAALMGGQLAVNPVQAYWDLGLADGAKVQVKCLVNGADPGSKAWANEHLVRSLPGVEWYALVIIEGFKVSGVAAFPPRCSEQSATP